MKKKSNSQPHAGRSQKEYPFIPRIINPVKMEQVIIFSADEAVRQSHRTVQAQMPWTDVTVLVNPLAVSALSSDRASVLILDDVAINLIDADKIRRNNSNLVIVLVSYHKLIHCAPPTVAAKEFPNTVLADLVFAVDRYELTPDHIITSIVRAAEDYLNIEKHSDSRRFIVLIVDDEPSWPSQFLPTLYTIIGQRACVKITRTYEEAIRFLFGAEDENAISKNYHACGFGDKVICLITDIFFPRGEELNCDAGKDLIRLVNKYYARIPIIIASKAKEAAELAPAEFVLPKGDPGSLEMLRNYIHDFTGMGDFVIHDEHGKVLHRLKNLHDIYNLLLQAESENPDAERLRLIMKTYGEKDKFSTWFYMHSLRELGDELRPQKHRGKKMITVLRTALKHEMQRMHHTPLIVGDIKVFTLRQLLDMLQVIPPEILAPYSDNDIISSWLDRKGHTELAEELRPIHGTGSSLVQELTAAIKKWIRIYEKTK
ncbi:MAG: hypothetical protein A2Y62_04625 [Candidatus Fischerbacteria bacterium RBG_13_37_8]|uniref:Uncharacterized protein n=1 Tax=Candidatus Fischerbacteria bacterium RBG_13_37_8 TaxID=1817863 RepID=A0A1F5VNU2_9BACT|nr:MAG: hypothetical protein A2Y62_04625 [Candidatus Fischerbacteria bacterium RBG_13_37_8]